jgi:NAD(P)-dependent dehydrogenase (short-subunit alcohol dehydrogenase family)
MTIVMKNGRLMEKVAIVTGAGSSGPGWGNGKAAAVLFAREGAKIFAVDLRPEAVAETKDIIKHESAELLMFPKEAKSSL